MATVQPAEFVIEARADAMLSELSNEFADIVLKVAASRSVHRNKSGVPIIDVCDIENAAHLLCAIIENGIKSGDIPAEGADTLSALRDFAKRAKVECAQHGGQVPPAPPTNNPTNI